MSATTTSATFTVSTAGGMQAFVTAVHNAIAACGGIVQTADTGQINPATATSPGGANISVGYEIYRFADALQATRPAYLRLEYGTGAGVSNPSIWATIGTGTDGAGNLTGAGTRFQIGSSVSAGTFNCYVSTTTGRLSMLLGGGTSGFMALAWERSLDSTGAVTSAGIVAIGFSASNNFTCWLPSSGSSVNQTGVNSMLPIGTSSGVDGTDVGVYPIYPVVPTVKHAIAGLALYFNSDVASGISQTVTKDGVVLTYKASGALKGPGVTMGTAPGTIAVMVLYQ